jgi:hypothetical protein
MTRRALQIVVLLSFALALSACDKSKSNIKPAPGAKAGHLTGKLSDAHGKPLSDVTIKIFGFSNKGEPVRLEKKIKGPAAEYDIEVPDGKYDTPTARIALEYNDHWYDLPLAAADGTREWNEQHDSAPGMVRDFVWKIAGRSPNGNADEPDGYWGGTVVFEIGGPASDLADIEITLTPDGPLIDGSDGQAVKFKRKLPWKKKEEHYLFDVPIGKYSARAQILYGGTPKPMQLVCYTIDPTNPTEVKTPDKMPTKIPLEFECQEIKKGVWKLLLPNLTAFPPL